MDRLRAFVLIEHAKVQRERLALRVAQLEGHPNMTPNFKGLATSFAQLRMAIEQQAQDALAELPTVQAAATAEIKRAGKNLADVKNFTSELKQFNDSVEGSNGGPSLAGSQPASPQQPPQSGSGQDPKPQPQAGWAGDKPQG